MKKKLIVLLTAVLAISMLFVSCSNETKLDERVNVSFGVSKSRSLSSSASYADFSTLDWYYMATTSSEFNYGAKGSWTKLDNGLETTLELSQGIWSFQLCAVSPVDNPNSPTSTLVYSGSRSDVLVQKSDKPQTITIDVVPGGTGQGTIVISSNIVVNKRTAEGYIASTVKANNWELKASSSSSDFSTTSGVFSSTYPEDKEIKEIPAGDYTVTVWYKDVLDPIKGTFVIRATEPIDVTVYANSTITVTGSINEETQAVIIKPISTYKSSASGSLTPSEDAMVSFDVTPAMTSSPTQKTTVTIPGAMIKNPSEGGTQEVALVLDVTVTPAKEASSDNSFVVSSSNAVAAAIDINLSLGGQAQEKDFDAPVKVETYVAKNLDGFKFSYSDKKEEWTKKNSLEEVILAKDYYYDSGTGKLTFLTDHFSTFIVETSSGALIGDVAYNTIRDAINAATPSDTVVLLNDFSLNVSVSKSVNIDGNGKCINFKNYPDYSAMYLANDNIEVNIKNLTIKTEGGGIWSFGNNITLNMENCVVEGATYFALYHNGTYSGYSLNAKNSSYSSTTDSNAIYISGSTETTTAAERNQQLRMENCVVVGSSGIEGKFTDMNLINCNVTALVDTPSFEQFNNGSTTAGFAVVSTDNSMSPDSPKPTARIVIDGGTYNGAIGLSSIVNKEQYPNFAEATYIFKNNPTINGGHVVECEVDSIRFSSVMSAEAYIDATPGNTSYENKELKLLKDSNISGKGITSVYNPAWFGSINLNQKTLTVSNFSTVISQNNTTVRNGKIIANTINKSTGEITGSGTGSYGLVIMANDVTLDHLEIQGGISIGGSKGETPNSKGARNATIKNCIVSTPTTWYAVCVQSGSSGTLEISNSAFTRTGISDLPLFQVAGSAGDFGSIGDTNTIVFDSVVCNTNPFPKSEVKVGDTVVFNIKDSDSIPNTRIVEAVVENASSDCTVTKNDNTWIISGTMSYTIQ